MKTCHATTTLVGGTTVTFTGTTVQLNDDANLLLCNTAALIECLQDGLQEEGSQLQANPAQCAAALYGATAMINLAQGIIQGLRTGPDGEANQ